MGVMMFVGLSLLFPSLLMLGYMHSITRQSEYIASVVILGVVGILAPFSAGWLLHEATYSGNIWPYATISWAGVFCGAALIRILDHRRLVASQKLINLRMDKLEQLERNSIQGLTS